MSSLEIELQDLREKNNDLVKKLQSWKMRAAQIENEKYYLMKENNDLRLKLSRLRSGGAAQARKLDIEVQSASKEAISQLLEASNAVTRTVQLVKTYMQERQELEVELPRWSSISNTPTNEKVHRVLPMLIGGQSIQPVVSLSRTPVNISNTRTNRSPNRRQNHNFPETALPMHLLQGCISLHTEGRFRPLIFTEDNSGIDLYIPLTRIDANGLPVGSMDAEPRAGEGGNNNSSEELGLDDSGEQSLLDSPNVSDSEQFNETPRLEMINEELTAPEETQSPAKARAENPLEGPSWMLDGINKSRGGQGRRALEPDSTTGGDHPPRASPAGKHRGSPEVSAAQCAFSPTVRRRKRARSPPAARRDSNNGRILKVLVSKLRLDDDVDTSPPKRPSLADPPAPSRSHAHAASPTEKEKEREPSPQSPPSRESTPPTPPPRRRAGASEQSLASGSRDRSPVRRHAGGSQPQRRRHVSPKGQVDTDTSPLRLSHDALVSFDAPSPNGATTSHVVVSESISSYEAGGAGEPAVARKIGKHDRRASRDAGRASRDAGRASRDAGRTSRDARRASRDTEHASREAERASRELEPAGRDRSNDSGDMLISFRETSARSGDGPPDGEGGSRARRHRKTVVYKEKPLNRKMRR